MVTAIDNLHIARIASLAGAPKVQSAGVDRCARWGDAVQTGASRCTASTPTLPPTWNLRARPAPSPPVTRSCPPTLPIPLWSSDDRPVSLLHFEDETAQAQRLAQASGIEWPPLPPPFPRRRTETAPAARMPSTRGAAAQLNHPNEKLTELLLAAGTHAPWVRTHITLVSTPTPPTCARTCAFNPGEVVSQRIVGPFLASLFDAVITVDPHLHRVGHLEEAVPVPQAVVLSGAAAGPRIAGHQLDRPWPIGPDEESAQWICAGAQVHGFDHGVCRKVRHGDREVQIHLPDTDVRAVPWCCWTTWPAAGAPWPVPRACCWSRRRVGGRGRDPCPVCG